MKKMAAPTIAALMAAPLASAHAQCQWASGFVPSPAREEFFHRPTAIEKLDGAVPKLLVAGELFGSSTSRIASWDGRTWEAFGPAFTNGTVHGLRIAEEFEGAQLYIWGTGNVPRFARWRNGSWEPMAVPFSGLSLNMVRDVAVADVQATGAPSLYVLGRMSISESRLLRWTGSEFETIWSGATGDAYAITGFDHDGSGRELLYMGGKLPFGSGPDWHVARYDGTEWEPLARATSLRFTRVGYLTVMQGPGDTEPVLYANGAFTSINGIPAGGIARFDGHQWTSLDAPFTSLTGRIVNAQRPGAEGIYASFRNEGGTPVSGLARYDGSTWTVVSTDGGGGAWLFEFDDGPGRGKVLYASASSTIAPGLGRLARWTGGEAGQWGSVGNALSGPVHTLAAYDRPPTTGNPGGKRLMTGGEFEYAGDQFVRRTAEWDGAAWRRAAFAANNIVRTSVWAEEAPLGPALYVGGDFTHHGVDANRIVRGGLTSFGLLWEPMSTGMNDVVYDLAIFDDGSGPALYAGGWFTEAGGTPVAHIARWDGQAWLDVGGGTDLAVRALAVYEPPGQDAALYAAGHFKWAGGAIVDRIAKWDGQQWTSVGGGVTSLGGFNQVYALAVHDDGAGPALYAGGTFEIAGGVSASNIARWDGSSWSGLGAGTDGPVRAIASHNGPWGSRLYIGGEFSMAGQAPARHLAAWNGSEGRWSASEAGTDGPVLTLASVDFSPGNQEGPRLYVGGDFTTVGPDDLPSYYIGELHCGLAPEPCYANCDGSTTEPILTVDDFTCFINEFAAAQGLPPAQQIEHYANCDGSTTEPIMTVDDFTCFINAFAAGCP